MGMTGLAGSSRRVLWPTRRQRTPFAVENHVGVEPVIPRTVVVVEAVASGHRLKYVDLVMTAARRRGSVVHFLTTPEVTGSAEFDLHLAARAGDFLLSEVERLDVAAIRAHLLLHGPCHVVAPTADHLALRIGLGRRWPAGHSLSLLVMRDPAAEPGAHAARRAKLLVKSIVLRRAGRMPGVGVYQLRSAGRTAPGAWKSIEDPVILTSTPTSVDALRSDWMLDDGRFWFGVIGAITRRKNLDLICQVMTHVDQPVGLLVAGKVGPDAQIGEETVRQLTGRGVRIHQVPRILTDLEIDSAISAVDCVLLMHSNEGPSGILGKAAAAGTRILAGGAQSLKDDLAALNTGSWVPLDPASLRRALSAVMSQPAPAPATHPSTASFDQLLDAQPSSLRMVG